MKLKKTPDLHAFLVTNFSMGDPSRDEQATRDFVTKASPDLLERLSLQTKLLLAELELPLDELGAEANRWFADTLEAKTWLGSILAIFSGPQSGTTLIVKDSNGLILNENDSVQVIKDLKVKGGSQDLKRGTLIKRIHLIDDPEAIECRVDGSVLVLKTCFLKKA